MRYFIYVIGLTFLLVTTGCTMDNAKTEQERIAEELDPTRYNNAPDDPEWDRRLGYVNYTKDQFDNESNNDLTVPMDRQKTADAITRVILQNEGFNEVATLVTDEEVLIAYDKNEDLTNEKAADIAKKSAMSITPRFFDVFVTDNPTLIPDIRSLHNSATNQNNYQNTLKQIISEMEQTSQEDD